MKTVLMLLLMAVALPMLLLVVKWDEEKFKEGDAR